MLHFVPTMLYSSMLMLLRYKLLYNASLHLLDRLLTRLVIGSDGSHLYLTRNDMRMKLMAIMSAIISKPWAKILFF